MKDHWGYEMLTCPGCGNRVLPGQKYCSECGRKLGDMMPDSKACSQFDREDDYGDQTGSD